MTDYLIDSHILLWARMERKRLSRPVIRLLEDPAQVVYYSIASLWELAIKEAKGKLPLPAQFYSSLSRLGFDCLFIEKHHIDTLRTLPLHHHDPFDRMLVAQAKAESLAFITADRKLSDYPIQILQV